MLHVMQNAEIQTWSEFFLTDEKFGGSVQTWLTEREVVFIFYVQKFQMKISDFSVQSPLQCTDFSMKQDTNEKKELNKKKRRDLQVRLNVLNEHL